MDEQCPTVLIPIWSRNNDARPVVVEWDADLPDSCRRVWWWESDEQRSAQVDIEVLLGRAPVRLSDDPERGERTPRCWYRFGKGEPIVPGDPGVSIPAWVLVAVSGALTRQAFAREVDAALRVARV